MSSNKPSNLSSSLPNPEANSEAAFLSANQEAFEQLVTFVDFAPADRFTIGFIEVNFSLDCVNIIKALKQYPRTDDIQFEILNFSDPNLKFLQDAILAELPRIQIDSHKKLVLIITGLEGAIGMVGDYPPVLQDLNYVRNAFTTSAPYPMLFCLPDYALTRLAKFAPDFWAWRIAVFRFESDSVTVDHALNQTLRPGLLQEDLGFIEKQERIDLLSRLLMQYAPSGQPETYSNLETRLAILMEMGYAYYLQGDLEKAEDIYNTGLLLSNNDEKLSVLKASILHCFGMLCSVQGRLEEAITLCQRSLEIRENIGDIQGKAATLHQIASFKARQGASDEAIALYQQSLELQERIGDVQGRATTLRQMATVEVDQGAVGKAIALYQQSLEFQERIGDVHGKALTLQCMANLKVHQRETEAAVGLFQQSLELQERIGDVHGKALTLQYLGGLAADVEGDFDGALNYLQESLLILQKLQSPATEYSQMLLDRVQKMKAEQENL